MKNTDYVAKKPNSQGQITYTKEENKIWEELYNKQYTLLTNRACTHYINGLNKLQLPTNKIPQLADIAKKLTNETGWSVTAVPSLINFKKFFSLLSNKQFPVATFIRNRKDFHYIKEPDIFHEVFGHCPLLTNHHYAAFMQKYGELAAQATGPQQKLFARLYWFTVEFGLINNQDGLRAYGAGILSSPKEIKYALDNKQSIYKSLDIIYALRTPYKIDHLQPIYFTIKDYETLFNLLNKENVLSLIDKAISLGEYPLAINKKNQVE